jgi:2-polyprenyl-3-methyl-5-hydroxy-6-metoxy-1,4-benzoquinol methylase
VAPSDDQPLSTEELENIIGEVRERVRARYPGPGAGAGDIEIPDLMPLVHARDAAEAKVASIGSVNPRRGGLLNSAVQMLKKTVARALDWHVREQVVFNRNVMACVEATLEAINQVNRTLVSMGAGSHGTADLRSHWAHWRVEWEQKLDSAETRLLRAMSDLQNACEQRVLQIESDFRKLAEAQHADFAAGLDRTSRELQDRFWADLERVRMEHQAVVQSELRIIRQRLALSAAPAQARMTPSREVPETQSSATQASAAFDYTRFAERFRGSEESVKDRQRFYLPHFAACRNVLDIGCGRGEFLELMRDAQVPARGIDLDSESIGVCRVKGLDAAQADLFTYLAAVAPASLDGIFCAQVVEHLAPERIPEMIRLAASGLAHGGVLAIETPNPECLAIFATHFYLDPTHVRPVPHPLLAFYLEEFGFAVSGVHKLSPAIEDFPALNALPLEVREAFFGGLDYAIIGRKLV